MEREQPSNGHKNNEMIFNFTLEATADRFVCIWFLSLLFDGWAPKSINIVFTLFNSKMSAFLNNAVIGAITLRFSSSLKSRWWGFIAPKQTFVHSSRSFWICFCSHTRNCRKLDPKLLQRQGAIYEFLMMCLITRIAINLDIEFF